MVSISEVIVEHTLSGSFNGKTYQSDWECTGPECKFEIKTEGHVPDLEFSQHLEEILKEAGFDHKDEHEKVFVVGELTEYELRHARMETEIDRLEKLPVVPQLFVAKYFSYQVMLRSLITRAELRLKALTAAQ